MVSVPTSARACALEQLTPVRQAVDSLGDRADPLFGFALDWLERNIPSKLDRVSLVHSDMGPGNFLAQAGRVTAIVEALKQGGMFLMVQDLTLFPYFT